MAISFAVSYGVRVSLRAVAHTAEADTRSKQAAFEAIWELIALLSGSNSLGWQQKERGRQLWL